MFVYLLLWEKLADILDVPVEEIYEPKENQVIICMQSSSCGSQRIAVFNPSDVGGFSGVEGTYRAIVITDTSGSYYTYFDPQNNCSGTISAYELNNSSGFFINYN